MEAEVESTSVTCPKCQHSFPLTAAIERPIVEKLEQQLAQRLVEERAKIVAEQMRKAKEQVSIQLSDLQAQIEEKGKKLLAAERQQLELLKQKRELDEQKRVFEVEKARQIEAERELIRGEAKKAALEEMTLGMRDLQEKLAAKDKKLAEAQGAELKLRQEKAEFEEEKKALELEVARRTDLVKEAVAKQKDEEFRLKELEFAKKEEGWKRQVDEMKRKVEQGSQQAQGEALEVDLEGRLRGCFEEDEVVEVAKGIHGGDVLQHVKDEMGHACGVIIWECKRTKTWSDGWLGKLKDDKLAAKAQIGVIVSSAMPKDVASFECREGIWVTTPALALQLAGALRLTLIEVAAARRSVEGMQGKMELVYEYISGPQFKARVMAIVEGFQCMREELEAEKKVIQKVWAKREKLLDKVLSNTVGMHGDVAGIIGKSLPMIEDLELSALADEPEDEDPHFRLRAIREQ
jgi:hypothetical protein